MQFPFFIGRKKCGELPRFYRDANKEHCQTNTFAWSHPRSVREHWDRLIAWARIVARPKPKKRFVGPALLVRPIESTRVQ